MGALSVVLMVVVLAVTTCLTQDEWETSSEGEIRGVPTTEDMWKNTKEEHILDQVPLIVGNNWLADRTRENLKNQLSGFKFHEDLTKDPKWNNHQTDLPRLRKGKVGAQFWAAWANTFNAQYKDAVQQTIEQIDVIKRLTAKYPQDLQFVDSAGGIERAFSTGKIGSLIGVQGGHTIDSRLAVLRLYYDAGVRYLTLKYWRGTPWSGGALSSSSTGLSNFGKNVVLEMNRLGMMVDLWGSTHQTIRDALETTLAPVIFSHSTAMTLCNSTRNLPDDILEKVKDNGGVVMVSFYSSFLRCDYTKATLDDVVAHINHIVKMVGVDHVGIGGGYERISSYPEGLEDVSHFPDLFDRLKTEAGQKWSDKDLKKLAGGNLLRVFKEVERVRNEQAGNTIMEELLPEDEIPKGARACRSDL